MRISDWSSDVCSSDLSADVLKHSETRELPYSPDQMFDLVSDIGSYAQFLPWVVGVRIRSRTEQEILADLLVGFGPLREKFTSRVTLDRPGSIEIGRAWCRARGGQYV